MSRGSRSRYACALACLVLAACSTASVPKLKSQVPVRPRRPEPEISAVSAPNPSAPASVLLVGRATGLPALLSFFSDMQDRDGLSELLSEILPNGAEIVDQSAPLDFAVLIPKSRDDAHDPRAVVSFGLSSLAKGIAYARRQEEAKQIGTAWYFKTPSPDTDWCAVDVATGPAPARAVCGEAREDVAEALNYMTRGLPLERHGSGEGVDVELRGEPARALLKPELPLLLPALEKPLADLGMSNPKLTAVWHEIAKGVSDEASAAVADFALIEASLTVDSKALVFGVTATADRASSWTARFMRDSSERSCEAPEAFWRLPEDATQAAYFCEWSPTQFDRPRRSMGDLVQALLQANGVSKQTRTYVRGATADLLTLPASYVLAKGDIPEMSRPNLSESALDFRRTLGWVIVGSDQPSGIYQDYFRRSLGLLNTAEVLKFLGLDAKYVRRESAPLAPAPKAAPEPDREGALQAFNRAGANLREQLVNAVIPLKLDSFPQIGAPAPAATLAQRDWPPKRQRGEVAPATGALRVMSPQKTPKGLPAGSTVFELELPASWFEGYTSKHSYKPLRVLLFVVPDDSPDGHRTWIAASTDQHAVVTRLMSVLDNKQALEQRRDLAPLRDVRSVAGGFVDVGATVNGLDRTKHLPSMPVLALGSIDLLRDGAVFAVNYRIDLETVGAMLGSVYHSE